MRISYWSSYVCSSVLLFTFDFGDGQSCADCHGLSILVDETAVERALLGLAAQQQLDLFLDLRCEVRADQIHQRRADQRLGIVIAEQVCERRIGVGKDAFLDVRDGVIRTADQFLMPRQIGSASCRERVFKYVYVSVGDLSLKKKNTSPSMS